MTPPTLILGAEWRVALTVARSLHAKGVTVDVAALSGHASLPPSRSVRRFHNLPDPNSPPETFLAGLLGLLEEEGYDYLVPTSDTALAQIADHDTVLRNKAIVAAPPPEILRRVLEKDATFAFAESIGVRVPETYPILTLDQLERLAPRLRFPLVAKGRSKSARFDGGFKARYFWSHEELVSEFHRSPEVGRSNVFQEYVPGVGVGIAVLMHDGEPLTAFQHRRLKELPATGGVAVTAVSEPLDPSLYDQAITLLRAIEWDGIAMVEFRQDRESGRVALMEINGRFWGSCSLAVAAGLDFPHYQYALAHGGRVPIRPTYRVGVKWRWTAGYLRRLHDIAIGDGEPGLGGPGRLQTFLDLPGDFRPRVVSALGVPNDHGPAWREAGATILDLWKRDLKRLIRWLLPERLIEPLKRLRQQPWRQTRWHAQAAIARLVGLGCLPSRDAFGTARTILFVCYGNIIRSAAAAAFLEAELRRTGGGRRWKIMSAGTNARKGKRADPRAVEAAQRLGANLSDHSAKCLTPDLVVEADMIFVMDEGNEAVVLAEFPASRRKTYLLGTLAGRPKDHTIRDPYHGSDEDVRNTLMRVHEEVRRIAGKLVETSGGEGSSRASGTAMDQPTP